MKLIKGEWWISPATFNTDENGKIQFSGFLGEYNLTYKGQQTAFTLMKEKAPVITIET
jgi:endo-1,4-beta-xylanase